jgi:hypothetical protein
MNMTATSNDSSAALLQLLFQLHIATFARRPTAAIAAHANITGHMIFYHQILTMSGGGLLGFVMSSACGTSSLSDEEMSSEVTATGPTASSLLLPNSAYTNTGMKAPAGRTSNACVSNTLCKAHEAALHGFQQYHNQPLLKSAFTCHVLGHASRGCYHCVHTAQSSGCMAADCFKVLFRCCIYLQHDAVSPTRTI